jgi:hypothetical protein
MRTSSAWKVITVLFGLCAAATFSVSADEPAPATASIDGTEPGWLDLGEADFVNVNCEPETWSWNEGQAHCTGSPVGVIRSQKVYTNLELMLEWRHLQSGGNSGVFIWTPDSSLQELKPGQLPQGIEVQVLDHGYAEQYEKNNNMKPDWFTTHGDVFPVGASEMTPFPPAAPDGKRSFPRKQLSKGVGEWNHYYIRCLNGEVRLWVNGTEVSGGTGCNPRSGYICLESEGAPVEFKNIRLRELP